LIKPKL